jgi:hypothetical protein
MTAFALTREQKTSIPTWFCAVQNVTEVNNQVGKKVQKKLGYD